MALRPGTSLRASPLRKRDFLWLACAIGILLAQQLAVLHLERDGAEALLRRGVFFVTTPALIVLALAFRRYIGAWLVAFGILLNFVPIAAHGGLMPVSYTIVRDSGAFPEITEDLIGEQLHNGKDILLRREDIHFYELSDRYTVDAPLYGVNIYSLGDFVLFAGTLLVATQAVVMLILPPRRARSPVLDDGTPA
ncbi:MAG: hypothetical protein C0506_08785 [Anaerolinea sp.]|nr:hypothetical protein [Anaerolinea sp.]